MTATQETARTNETGEIAVKDLPDMLADDLAGAARAARAALRALARTNTTERRAMLEAMAVALEDAAGEVLATNSTDVARAREAGTPDATVDRLTLTERRV